MMMMRGEDGSVTVAPDDSPPVMIILLEIMLMPLMQRQVTSCQGQESVRERQGRSCESSWIAIRPGSQVAFCGQRAESRMRDRRSDRSGWGRIGGQWQDRQAGLRRGYERRKTQGNLVAKLAGGRDEPSCQKGDERCR